MSNKNHSGDSAQLSLFDILGLAGNIDSKYSSDEIEEVIGKLRAAKRTAEKHEENERRRREKEELERKAYAFVTDASEDTVTIGIIVRNYADVHKLISGYLQAIEMELKDTCLEEITFNNFRNMLSCADRYDYINDDDEVLEQFDLDKLNARFGRSVEYGENILDCCDKKSVYNEARRFLAKDTFIPELDRIYAGSTKHKVSGHPVHYMIQTDDGETRKGMLRVLLQALYANSRILSKR